MNNEKTRARESLKDWLTLVNSIGLIIAYEEERVWSKDRSYLFG